MSTTTVTSETVFKNWSTMQDWISNPDSASNERVVCANCLIDGAHERFGSDPMCTNCLTLIRNVLAAIRNGSEHGSIYVAE